MMEISNKAIVGILTVALLISLLGTSVNILRLTNLQETITGAATSTVTGQTNLTVTAITSITNRVDGINLGSGSVAATCNRCDMDTQNGGNSTGACCIGFNNITQGFLLENTGNQNLSVNYTCAGNCTAATLIGGTSPVFSYRTKANALRQQSGEGSTLDTTESCRYHTGTHNWTSNDSYTAVSAAGGWLCGNSTHFAFGSHAVSDAGVIDLNFSIPDDTPTTGGSQVVTFTFLGTSSG